MVLEMLSIASLVTLGPIQIDAASIGPWVTVLLISLLLAREVLSSSKVQVRRLKYMDMAIVPLFIVFLMLILDLLLNS